MENFSTTEYDVENAIQQALLNETAEPGKALMILTFEEAGIMSTNRGVVIRIGTREFQVTIVRSK
jgi:hypothetical protein